MRDDKQLFCGNHVSVSNYDDSIYNSMLSSKKRSIKNEKEFNRYLFIILILHSLHF